jgi:glutamine synthetase
MDNKSILEYVWIDGNNKLRSKTRVIYEKISHYDNSNLLAIPKWNFDGSSTGQASGFNSEITIIPKAIFRNPFQYEYSLMTKCTYLLVLCDTYDKDGIPLPSNNRYNANKLFNEKIEEEPWFGLEQEYFIEDTSFKDIDNHVKHVKHVKQQGDYYCGVGNKNAIYRNIAEQHLNYCIMAGVKIAGINAEVAPQQWEYQIGICKGIEAGDHLWMARYILERIGEEHNVSINILPKPLKGNWNGSGCHTNYSTLNMREGTDNKSGLDYINDAIIKLSENHDEHMKVYGSGNEERMTGEHETASYDKFTDGIANRGASVRRGHDTIKNKKGYFEDRRPSSNCDPYSVTSIIFKTTCLNNTIDNNNTNVICSDNNISNNNNNIPINTLQDMPIGAM